MTRRVGGETAEDMKLCVLVRGEWLAIACEEKQTVGWLAREILRGYCRKKGIEDPESFVLGISRMRRARCGTELRSGDVIGSKLDENDIISIGRPTNVYSLTVGLLFT